MRQLQQVSLSIRTPGTPKQIGVIKTSRKNFDGTSTTGVHHVRATLAIQELCYFKIIIYQTVSLNCSKICYLIIYCYCCFLYVYTQYIVCIVFRPNVAFIDLCLRKSHHNLFQLHSFSGANEPHKL